MKDPGLAVNVLPLPPAGWENFRVSEFVRPQVVEKWPI